MRSRGELAGLIVMAFLRAVALGWRAKASNASATCGAAAGHSSGNGAAVFRHAAIGQSGNDPFRLVAVDNADGWRAPDREIPHGHNQVVAPLPINGADGAVEVDQQFGLLPRGDPGRKDVTPQAANIAEADAIGLTSLADEIAKQSAPHGGGLLYSKAHESFLASGRNDCLRILKSPRQGAFSIGCQPAGEKLNRLLPSQAENPTAVWVVVDGHSVSSGTGQVNGNGREPVFPLP